MKGIRIENLYGHFNYDISLSDDGMTIITGPNGFGKSTILRMINELANSNLDFFFDLPFSEIEIRMSEEKFRFKIQKEHDSLWIQGCWLDRQDFMEWKKDSIRRASDEQSGEKSVGSRMEHISKIVIEMQKITGKVFLIEEQRLVRREIQRRVNRLNGNPIYEQKIVQTVSKIPEQLRDMMNRTASDYSKTANELDSTFPQRLFAQSDGLTQAEFNKSLSAMHEKVKKLQEYGISNIGKVDDIQFKENDARALKVYFSDFEKKYCRYEALITCLDLFLHIINDRFLFKTAHISAKEGLNILDDQGNAISLLDLSSGEKETLVLFYQIIFEIPQNSILLIDEPEISFHIAWQRKFAESMQSIVKTKGIQVIIATHSVQIINGNSRIQRDLGKQYAENRFHSREYD